VRSVGKSARERGEHKEHIIFRERNLLMGKQKKRQGFVHHATKRKGKGRNSLKTSPRKEKEGGNKKLTELTGRGGKEGGERKEL